jgi:hypothetical protein
MKAICLNHIAYMLELKNQTMLSLITEEDELKKN